MTGDGGSPESIYASRRDRHLADRRTIATRERRISWARLVVAVVAIAWVVLAERQSALRGLAIPGAVALALVFIVLVRMTGRLREQMRVLGALAAVNDESEHRSARRWDRLPLLAPSLPPEGHPVAADLDLFGRVSLFQLLGTTATAPGRTTLRDWLLFPAPPAEVARRQEAVRELAPQVELRESIAARGRLAGPVAIDEVERFCAWAEGSPWLLERTGVIWASRLLPLAVLVTSMLAWVGWLPSLAWLLPLGAGVLITGLLGSRVRTTLDAAFARESPVRRFAPVLELIERTEARAPLLEELRDWLRGVEGRGTEDAGSAGRTARRDASAMAAHREIARLGRIADLAHVRWSPSLHLTLQALVMWDVHVLASLERWQRRAGAHAREWLAALGEYEALAALAALAHDNPGWAFPDTTLAGDPVMEAESLAHPLLPEAVRVANDVRVGPPGTFLLVTGSNMSGKSTLLRAIGVNVVLAQCGGPVCATRLRVPPVRIETCVHVEDSLALGLSRFMAELTRLKGIVDAARIEHRRGERTLLFLIDEMLQGTNTNERQVAARRIIGFLLEQRAIGAVTTHDLALAETPELAAAARAVHFRETIRGETDGAAMTFDYRLRPGIATSVNALRLMELIGLGEERGAES